MKTYIATSRPIGEECKALLKLQEESTLEQCEVFISIMYDKLVTDEFIKSKVRCFNFHPGLLPEYRGSGAYSWAIINGEKESGVTLHIMDKDIDHGDIIQRKSFPIALNDTAEDLFKKAEVLMVKMVLQWYPMLSTHPLQVMGTPQDESKAHLYYRKDLDKAKDITRFKRAFTFEGKERAYYFDNGEKIYI